MHKTPGRQGRSERSSTEGQFWDTPIQPVYKLPDGSYSTALDLYRRGLTTSKLNREPIGMRFDRRKHCGKPIAKDSRGFAFCPICSKIFNSGKADDDDFAESDIRAAGYSHQPENAPPPSRYRKPKRAAR